MFERYTETARRVIFFARYEASQFGADYVQPEHLVLGLFREDKALVRKFLSSHAAAEELRKQIAEQFEKREKLSTSVEISLDKDAKRVLAFAADEAPTPEEIGTAHLLLGVLRLGNHFAAEILRERGLSVEDVRQELKGAVPKGSFKKAHFKPTACRDCRHLIVDETKKALELSDLYCGATPTEPVFDCYTGEFKSEPEGGDPVKRFQRCETINFGECKLFKPKEEQNQGTAIAS
jgi:ATP-dependent Clp protease ATP-binding subunit ClpA